MFHKFTRNGDDRVLAVADKDLVGEVLSKDDVKFEIKESFYGDEEISEKRLAKLSSESTIINAVGERAVSTLIENNIIDEDKVLDIDGVPHAQMVRF